LIVVFETRDDPNRRGYTIGEVAYRAHRPAEACAGVIVLVHILELVDTNDKRDPLEVPHETPDRLDGALGVSPGNDASQNAAIIIRKVLAPQIAEHTGFDARLV